MNCSTSTCAATTCVSSTAGHYSLTGTSPAGGMVASTSPVGCPACSLREGRIRGSYCLEKARSQRPSQASSLPTPGYHHRPVHRRSRVSAPPSLGQHGLGGTRVGLARTPLEAKVPIGEPLARLPGIALAANDVHRQLDLIEDVEAQLVEEADGFDVTCDRPDLDCSGTALTSSRDDRVGEQPPESSSSMLLGDDDGLELGDIGNQPCEPDRTSADLCDPDVLCADLREVLVEGAARVVSTDLRGVEDVAMPLGQLRPELAARLQIARLVASDRRHEPI